MPLAVMRGERKPGAKWLARDAALAQALTTYEAMLCPGCGQPLVESMDPESEGQWKAPPPSRCHACTAIHERAAAYSDGKAPTPEALRFSAERHVRARPAPAERDLINWPTP